MNIPFFIYKSAVLILLLSLAACSGKGASEVRIAFINSLKGQIFALPVMTGTGQKQAVLLDKHGQEVRKSGVSLLSSTLKQLEKAGGPIIKLANANFIYGSSVAYFTDGRQVVTFLENLGFYGLVLGHRDFYFGPDILDKLALEPRKDKGTFISANILNKADGKRPSFLKPYHIYTLPSGKTVAVIGLIPRSAISQTPPAQFARFQHVLPDTVIDAVVSELRNRKVDRIIVAGDFNLAIEEGGKIDLEPDVAAILNRDIDLFIVRSKKPVNRIVTMKQGGRTARLVAITEGAEVLGLYCFRADPADDSFSSYELDSRTIKPDLSLSESLYNLRESLEVIAGKQLGLAEGEMTHYTSRESALGNLVCDALRDYCRTQVVLINSGAIKHRLTQGPITRKDLYTILPYQNLMVGLQLTGAQLLDVLENSVTYLGENEKAFPQVSGIQFRYNSKNPAGQRLNRGSVLVGGAWLNPGAVYTVAVPAFIAAGGDHYTTLAAGIKEKKYTVFQPFYDQIDRNIVETYIERYTRAGGSVFRKIEGRIIDTAAGQ